MVFEDRTLTYAALDAHANRLAHRLRDLGVGPDVLVGVCAERSLELVVGLLAVLKAGGAYLPLDPEYPAGRLTDMVSDAGAAGGAAARRGTRGAAAAGRRDPHPARAGYVGGIFVGSCRSECARRSTICMPIIWPT